MRGALALPILRGPIVVAIMIGGMPLASQAAAPADARREKAKTFEELTEQAEGYRAAGSYAKSAHSFTAAYDVLTESEQSGLKGKITVNNAVDDFRLAQEQDPDSLLLLEEEAVLLRRFIAHPKRKGDVPAGLAEELERVEIRIEELRAREEEVAREKEARAEEERKARNADAAIAVALARSRRKADAAILGVGIVSIVGGTALIADGLWNLGNVGRRGGELLGAVDANSGGTDEMREALRGEIEGWQNRWRGIGTGLAVGGAVLTAAGIGLTTWGVVRMRRGKRRPGQVSAVHPMISGRGVGLSVAGRY